MDEQSGFRQCRSTENQLTYIAQTIEDGFQDKKHSVVVWVDMAKAFDRVWKEGILIKLLESKISHNMLRWIEQYLKKRTGRISLQGIHSREAPFRHGVPPRRSTTPHTVYSIYEQHTACYRTSGESCYLC